MLTIVLVVLAGFGALSLLWAVFGGLLPCPGKMVLLQVCRDLSEAEMAIHRHRWLTGIGALRCPLMIVDGGLAPEERETLLDNDIETWGQDRLEDLFRREMRTDGGAGDPERHGGSRGVPEL